jgi:phosphatidylglycerol lysyltransferase
MRLLAALLAVWTVLLALPSSARWFPSPAWQYGWVAFDVAVAAALLVLAARWRPRIADLLATAITADAVLTLAQAIVFNWPRRDGPFDVVVIVVAVLAPTIAAALLWNARGHRRAR